ncbi:MAG: hypothetical protein ACR2IY_04775, partial [Rubrivivax sp.]
MNARSASTTADAGRGGRVHAGWAGVWTRLREAVVSVLPGRSAGGLDATSQALPVRDRIELR